MRILLRLGLRQTCAILPLALTLTGCDSGFKTKTPDASSLNSSSTASAVAADETPQSITNVGPNITGASALTVAAGGQDQNLILSGSGKGSVILNANVGIGTATPAHALEVNGSVNATAMSVAGTSVLTSINAAMVKTALGYTPVNPSSLTAAASLPVSTTVVSNTLVQRDSNGYINTNYLNMTANVAAGSPEYLVGEWGADHYLRYVTPAGVTVGNATNAVNANVASKVNGTGVGAMTFNWNGQVGQPTWLWGSNDGTNLYVWNPANFNVNYANSAGSANTANTAGALNSGGDNVSTSGWYRSNGQVGWYNNTYGGGIVMTDATWVRTFGNKGFYVQGGSLMVDGTGTFSQSVTAPTFTMTSDRRLKQDIKPLTPQLQNILGLEPVQFLWNAKARERGIKDETKQIGFIAQDIEKKYPEAVLTGKDGFKSVNYPSLISPVVAALKEFYAEWHADQQSKDDKIKLLEQRIDHLEKLLNERTGGK